MKENIRLIKEDIAEIRRTVKLFKNYFNEGDEVALDEVALDEVLNLLEEINDKAVSIEEELEELKEALSDVLSCLQGATYRLE